MISFGMTAKTNATYGHACNHVQHTQAGERPEYHENTHLIRESGSSIAVGRKSQNKSLLMRTALHDLYTYATHQGILLSCMIMQAHGVAKTWRGWHTAHERAVRWHHVHWYLLLDSRHGTIIGLKGYHKEASKQSSAVHIKYCMLQDTSRKLQPKELAPYLQQRVAV